MADLHSYFGGVYNHHGSTLLSLSIRKLNTRGKRHSDFGWFHPMVNTSGLRLIFFPENWCSGVNEKEKVVMTSD